MPGILTAPLGRTVAPVLSAVPPFFTTTSMDRLNHAIRRRPSVTGGLEQLGRRDGSSAISPRLPIFPGNDRRERHRYRAWDSSVSPTHAPGGFGLQRPFRVFLLSPCNQSAIWNGVRPGNVHSAEAGATFWNPSLSVTGTGTCAATSEGIGLRLTGHHEFLEAEATPTPSVSKPTRFFRKASPICSPVPLAVRPTMCGAITPAVIRLEAGRESAGSSPRWNGIPANCSRVGFIVTNLSRRRNVWSPDNQRGKAEQYIKECKNAIKWTRLSCRRSSGSSFTPWPTISPTSCGHWQCRTGL